MKSLLHPVGQLILLPPYPILKVLSFTTDLLDARLHLIGRDFVRYDVSTLR